MTQPEQRDSYYRYENNAPAEYTPDYIVEQEEDAALTPSSRGRGIRIIALVLAVCAAASVIGGMSFTVLRAAKKANPQAEIIEQTVNTDPGENIASGEDEEEQGGSANAGRDSSSSTMTLNISENQSAVLTDVTQVVREVMPAIVAIDNSFTERERTIYGVYEYDALGTGSGVIIGRSNTELLIVTNNHVISGANELKVRFIGDGEAPAQVRGTNAGMDLAVIVVELEDVDAYTQEMISVATLGDSDLLQMGEPVIAIGNAQGLGQSVTTGVVSALNRDVTSADGLSGTFIQTDAAINHGNSGGALLNSRGEVIGINTLRVDGSAVEGIGFAIPITKARETIERLMNLGIHEVVDEENRGYFGISVTTAVEIPGAYVSAVREGSAAEEAGLVVSDIITGVEELPVTSQEDLLSALEFFAAGDTITITIQHKTPGGYVEQQKTVTLQSAEETAD